MSYLYHTAILGGTFDHFHAGHKHFVKTAFDSADQLTIGLVHSVSIQNKLNPASLEAYDIRESNLKSFLLESNLLTRATIIPIYDIYGTTLTNPDIQAIFVTDSTHSNAIKINRERESRSLPPLQIIVIPHALGSDHQIISSGRIRSGEIDRDGQSYLQFFLDKKIYLLPQNLRQPLQNPLGTVITNVKSIADHVPATSLVISIGDIVSLDLLRTNQSPALCVVDYKTRRKQLDPSVLSQYFLEPRHKLGNPAGTINPHFAKYLSSSLSAYCKSHAPQLIEVDGEEDLLALPAMLLAPLDAFVIYGQYKLGMVVVQVTEAIKSQAKQLLSQFT